MAVKIPFSKIQEAIDGEDYIGFCIACGAESDGCEPDARRYPCEDCGENKVFGAEEILVSYPELVE